MKRGRTKILKDLWKFFRREYNAFTRALSSFGRKFTKVRETSVAARGLAGRRRPTMVNYVNPLFWVMQTFWFVVRYLTSRDLITALQGAPAVIGLIIPVVAGYWLHRSVDDRTAHARERLNFYAERGRLDDAEFYSRQMCFLDPSNPEVLLNRAKLLDAMDRSDEAKMTAITLAKEFDYTPALKWYCLTELEDLSQLNPSGIAYTERSNQLVSMVSALLDRDPRSVESNRLMGILRIQRGEYLQAVSPLRTIIEESPQVEPDVWYRLAIAQYRTGLTEEARQSASTAADGFLERDAREIPSLARTRESIDALVLAEREPEAIARLNELILHASSHHDRNNLMVLQALVRSGWCHRLRTNPQRSPTDLAQALAAISEAIRVAVDHPDVQEEFVQLVSTPDVDDTAFEYHMQIAISNGIAPGLVRFVNGTRLLTGDPPDFDGAIRQFEVAEAQGVLPAGLLNNLADALVESDNSNDDDLNRAMTFVNQAIAYRPDVPHFRDTRGKIHLKQGNAIAAIADFELALKADDIRHLVAESLAEAWRMAGDEDESERYRKLAIELRQQRESPPADTSPPTRESVLSRAASEYR